MISRWPFIAILLVSLPVQTRAAEPDEFFETKVRPVLAHQCWSCHAAGRQEGGLRLDSLGAALRGGSRGPAIVVGDPDASLLIQAVRHIDLKMPLGGRLSDASVANLALWIRKGAQWPSGPEPSEIRARDRSQSTHWALQPVRAESPPSVQHRSWVANEIDAFVLSRLEPSGYQPAAPASRRDLIRRLTFDMTGLPPRPEQVEAFVRDGSPVAYEDLVERLLASERFGEHWARHWMDWVRYCESHGSQGDFELPMAWAYRDYLIRAFNADVPYDQMLREYFAGDLLENPRINAAEGLNESRFGPGNLRMVEYGYLPVDALGDQVKVVDNQIDVFSKAFQGLTVSCARCHDHKFDPITQDDYYALYGIFASSRPGLVAVDSDSLIGRGQQQLKGLRLQIRERLAEVWAADRGSVATLLRRADAQLDRDDLDQGDGPESPQIESLLARLGSEHLPGDDPLRVWLELRGIAEGEDFRKKWAELGRRWQEQAREAIRFNHEHFRPAWDLENASDAAAWFPTGPGIPRQPATHGEFRVEPEGDVVISTLLPAGVHTGLDSAKFGGITGSPRFRVRSNYISLRLYGDNFASVKLVVENYPIGDGGIHPAIELTGSTPGWVRLGTAYRKGQMAHIELQTLLDRSRPFRPNRRKPERTVRAGDRSSFGVSEVVFHDIDESPRKTHEAMLRLLGGLVPSSLRDVESRIDNLAREAAEAWGDGSLDRNQFAFLDSAVRSGILSVRVGSLPQDLRDLVEAYRSVEALVPVPRRAPGVLPGTGFDQPLFLNGNHDHPGEPVERRYLEVLGSRPFRTGGSGRLELANAIADDTNPLTARVLVNRLWHYLFGQGIVPTVDNFGLTGERPSHPELLDFLALRFVEEGWSIKKMVRYIVSSNTYRMGTESSAAALRDDPSNRLLQHQNVRRLPAESIRDAILSTSGDLDLTMYGPSINVYYVGKTEGGGTKGPLDGARRRSVYQAIKRNAQNPFLEVFDSPKPTTTRGRRDTTNIPAQSLAMLNDPFVVGQAARWTDRALADGSVSPKDRAERMFRRAVGRLPDDAEADLLLGALTAFAAGRKVDRADWMGSRDIWTDLAQSLFNLKQFIYLR